MFNRFPVSQSRLSWLDGLWHGCDHLGFLTYSPASQKVNAAIVSDAEQPRLDGTAVVEFVQLPVGFEQSFLHNVFAVHDRSCHASAVAMQAWPEGGDGLKKRQVACFEWAGIFDELVLIRAVHGISTVFVTRYLSGTARHYFISPPSASLSSTGITTTENGVPASSEP